MTYRVLFTQFMIYDFNGFGIILIKKTLSFNNTVKLQVKKFHTWYIEWSKAYLQQWFNIAWIVQWGKTKILARSFNNPQTSPKVKAKTTRYKLKYVDSNNMCMPFFFSWHLLLKFASSRHYLNCQETIHLNLHLQLRQ